jgi:phosphoribosylformimino-5-aminoimidazole carboxamide ribonucleotide (ProFAR) isomerase
MSFRIGATVLLDCNGKALQSYSFQTKRVLGCIKNVLFFLNAYKVDEIHLIIPLKGKGVNTSKTLAGLKDTPISTPLSVGGGVDSVSLIEITKDPYFERLIFNSSIFDDNEVIKQATLKMGHQAIVGYIPFILKKNTIKIYHSKRNKFIDVSDKFWENLNSICNEVILLDANAEGGGKGFNFKVFQFFNFPINRVLISGGLTKLDISKAKEMKLAGVSLDNITLHSEFSIRGLR